MNMVEFQEKMDPTHRASLCRMLRTEQLPECLLTEYLKAKKMVDIIDGSLTVGELAIIALSAGYNPDTGKFEQTFIETTELGVKEGEDARMQAQADKMAVKSPVEPQSLDESDDTIIEEVVEQPIAASDIKTYEVSKTTEQPVIGVTGQAVEKPAPEKGKAMLWAPGMPVNVLQEDELNHGKIFAVHPGGENDPLKLTVTLDNGETVTVNEDEAEAV